MSVDHDHYTDDYIRTILREVKTIAMVGASANQVRPSFFVLKYLLSKGYDMIPVNPGQAGREICGVPAMANLRAITEAARGPVDMVDIFRNSEAAAGVVEEALELDPLPKAIWMQLGVRNDPAAARAESAGVRVVMNRCPKIEYARLCGEIGWAGVRSGVISSRKPAMQQGFQRFGIVGRKD